MYSFVPGSWDESENLVFIGVCICLSIVQRPKNDTLGITFSIIWGRILFAAVCTRLAGLQAPVSP